MLLVSKERKGRRWLALLPDAKQNYNYVTAPLKVSLEYDVLVLQALF